MAMRWLAIMSLLVASLAPIPAAAQEGDRFTTYFAAADRLDRLVGAAGAAASPPRVADAEVEALLRAVTDTAVLAVDREDPDAAQQDLMRVANRVLGFIYVYLDWGIAADVAEGRREPARQRNFVRYQPELVPLWAFIIDTMGSLTRARTAQARLRASEPLTDPQRGRLNQMRTGLMEFIDGFLDILVINGVEPESRLAMVEAFARQAEDLAGALTLSQRRRAWSMIQTRSSRLGPRSRAAIDRAGQAFATSSCAGLCAL